MSFLDELSARLGVPFSFAPLTDGCRALLIDGAVVLDENLTPERAHWAYCHEVAHLRLEHQVHLPRDDAEEREQEAAANLLASDLLLPEEQFRPLARCSLAEMKEHFPYASHEVLARCRMRHRPGMLTIYDNGKLTSRLAPDGWNAPARLFPLEMKAYRRCLKTKRDVLLEDGPLSVEATYVDEGRSVIRVILFLEGEENV